MWHSFKNKHTEAKNLVKISQKKVTKVYTVLLPRRENFCFEAISHRRFQLRGMMYTAESDSPVRCTVASTSAVTGLDFM